MRCEGAPFLPPNQHLGGCGAGGTELFLEQLPPRVRRDSHAKRPASVKVRRFVLARCRHLDLFTAPQEEVKDQSDHRAGRFQS